VIQKRSPSLTRLTTLEKRSAFVEGRQEIVAFLSRKWRQELDYRLIKAPWAFEGNPIGVALPRNGTMTPEIVFTRMAMHLHVDDNNLMGLACFYRESVN
jgi:Protein of unknown function (DUF1348)